MESVVGPMVGAAVELLNSTVVELTVMLEDSVMGSMVGSMVGLRGGFKSERQTFGTLSKKTTH